MSTKPVTVSLHYTVFRIVVTYCEVVGKSQTNQTIEVVKKYGAYDSRAAPLRRSAASRSVGERSDPNSSSGSGSGLRTRLLDRGAASRPVGLRLQSPSHRGTRISEI